MVKIYLDPGHGGSDPGATANGLKEKDVTLKIALETQRYLIENYSDHTVKMSRSNDKTVSLSKRTSEANGWGADVLVSIHINASNGKANGYEDFIFNNLSSRSKSPELQNAIHKEVSKLFDTNRGKKKANFHMLRESNAYAVLTENGFIDNKKDADFLKKDSNLKKLGEAHAKGIANFLGLKKKTTSTKKSSTSNKSTGKLYKVQTGAFSKKSNAEDLAKKLKKDGYDTFIVYE